MRDQRAFICCSKMRSQFGMRGHLVAEQTYGTASFRDQRCTYVLPIQREDGTLASMIAGALIQRALGTRTRDFSEV